MMLGTTPRVSVCMATFNGSRFLREQMSSILSELDSTDEVVVVDDASSDDTLNTIEGLGDERVKVWVHARNRGYVRSFEEALSRASGKYLFLSDQDDVWVPGRVSEMVAALERHDVVATNLAVLNGPDRIRGPFGIVDWRVKPRDSGRRVKNVSELFIGIACYWGCAMAVRRDALRYILPFPEFLNESHDLWIALAGNVAGSMAHLDERTVLHRYHESNITPTSWRSLRHIIGARVMLARCLFVVLNRLVCVRTWRRRGKGGF